VPAIAREAGLDNKTARAEARLAVAIVRGLLLDLLATGDREAATEAYERYLFHTEATLSAIRHTNPADETRIQGAASG